MVANNGLDSAMLEGLKDLLGAKFEELVETYINDSGKRLERLKTAIEEKDFGAIHQEAHGMKGSSRNIGANAFAEHCAEFERKGKEQIDDNIKQQFAALEQQFAAICDELKSYL